MRVAFLGSGSSGNCAVIQAGKTAVLLDAGLTRRQTKRRLGLLGLGLEDLSGAFLTHEHTDHVAGITDLINTIGFPVHATEGTEHGARLPGPLFADIRRVRGGREVVLGDLFVRTVSIPHDGAEPVCYVFSDAAGARIGIATDLGYLSPEVFEALGGCDVIGLEFNHDVDMLRIGPYTPRLKARILGNQGHLSNEQAAAGLQTLIGPRTRQVVLLHLSEQNNTPVLAGEAARVCLEKTGADIEIAVATRHRPAGWFETG